MFTHLLLATDGSELAEVAVARGLQLAQTLQADVTVVHVTPPVSVVVPAEAGLAFSEAAHQEGGARTAALIFERVEARAREHGVACRTVHVTGHRPADGIIQTADAKACDLIVVGSHGRRGLSRLTLGSQANEVAARTSVPVLIFGPLDRPSSATGAGRAGK
ncbi:MAG: universal stress protein [Pseudomonadota bacterium]